ncbi:MAG: ATP-binding protein, partial [Candidatus Eremiobacteraeota bacterium]|nr:ATP-binding protein [Candidatus Eremiobacteraeota bacterium]
MPNRDVSLRDMLESADYEALFEYLAAINQETQTLECKADLNPVDVAREAVAFANAIGGVIVVGINDPVDGVPLSASSRAEMKIDEPARRRLRSQILSRTYPPIPVEIYGYDSGDGKTMLAVAVGESAVAPHEYIAERGRFPIRRGAQVDYLSLGELENLIRRRDASANGLDTFSNAYPRISLDRSSGDDFLGVRLAPIRARPRVMIRRDQLDIETCVRSLPGLACVTAETLADGILFRDPLSESLGDAARDERWLRRCYVRADGAIELRFPIEPKTMLLYQVYRVLGNAYALSGWVLRLLGEGPLVRGCFA